MATFSKALILAIIFALVTVIAGVLHAAPWTDTPWQRVLLGLGSLGCFGFLLGGIFAFDPASDLKIKPSAIGRMAFGIAAALMLSALWHWPVAGAALAALISAVLGYFGMLWADHVNF